MSVTIPSLDPVTDILDTDKIMVTQSSGQTYTIDGASFNKRNQAVIANSTTLTGAPLKTGNIVRAYFTADITGVNTTTGLVLNYNGTNKNVKVPKDGALVNFTAQNMGGSPTVYKYLQAYTTLELLYDGTNFVIIGNPVVISGSDFTYYADGLKRINSVTNNDKNMVTSNAVFAAISRYNATSIGSSSGNSARFTKITGLFPTSNITSNVFILTDRGGETHILIFGSSNDAVATTPIWFQLYEGSSKIDSISYDLTNKEIIIKEGTYSSLKIRQIGGTTAILATETVSSLFPNVLTKKILQYS